MEERVALDHLQAHKLLIIKMKSWKEEWFEGVEKVRVLKLVGYLKLNLQQVKWTKMENIIALVK
jgi:hypothetical protein